MEKNRWDTSRIEAFSDGVFSIAITLLVLDLGVAPSEFKDLWHGIAEEWPAYLGFVTSFVTIGALWMAHHAIFRRIALANAAVMRINLLLLMGVSFLPFPTRLMAEAIKSDSAERAAVIFSGGSLLLVSALFWVLWSAVARDRELLRPEVTDAEVATIQQATTPSLGFYVVVIALAFVAPQVAVFGYLAIAVFAVARARGDQRSRETAAGGT